VGRSLAGGNKKGDDTYVVADLVRRFRGASITRQRWPGLGWLLASDAAAARQQQSSGRGVREYVLRSARRMGRMR